MTETNGHQPPELPNDSSKTDKPNSDTTDPAKLAKSPEPISGGSLVSWAQLLRQAQRPSDDEVNIGSLPEIRIDAVSDNDLIKHLEREAGGGSSRKLLLGGSSKKIKPPPLPTDASAATKGPAGDSAKHEEWYKELPEDGGSSVDLMNAAKAALSLAADDRGQDAIDNSDIFTALQQADDGTSAVNLGKEPRSAPITPAIPKNMPLSPRASTRPGLRPASRNELMSRRPRPVANSWLGGALGGVAGAGIVAAGLWAVGDLRIGRPRPAPPLNSTAQEPAKPTPEQAQQFLVAGDPQKAIEAFSQCESSPAVLCGRGQARWLSYLRQQKLKHLSLAENDKAIEQARQDLIAAKSAEGSLWLGLINESFGNFATAPRPTKTARCNTRSAPSCSSQRLALDAMTNHHDQKMAAIADPQLGFALSLLLLQLPADAGGPGDSDEAGFDFWEAVRLSRAGEYAAACDSLKKARAAHELRRNVVLRQGLNPDSDPRRGDFPAQLRSIGCLVGVPGEVEFRRFQTRGAIARRGGRGVVGESKEVRLGDEIARRRAQN